MLVFFIVSLMLHKTCGVPTPLIQNGVKIQEVPYGETVVLQCRSNDDDHIFDYWLFSNQKVIIGPSNNYDKLKYKYQTLSGNLTIRGVTKQEEGLYGCISKAIRGENIKIEYVQMVVVADWEEIYEHDSAINTIRIIIILITLVILGGGAYLVYRIWKDRYRYPRYLEQSEEDDDDDSAEEIFTAPSTSGTSRPTGNIVLDNNKTKTDSFESLNIISTDFKSILDTANDN